MSFFLSTDVLRSFLFRFDVGWNENSAYVLYVLFSCRIMGCMKIVLYDYSKSIVQTNNWYSDMWQFPHLKILGLARIMCIF